MRKIYLLSGTLLVMLLAIACGNSDQPAEQEAEEEIQTSEHQEERASPEAAIKAYANDKSTISGNDIDLNDPTFTSRTKLLYRSEENGKSLAVVYGFKNTDNGIAIIQIEGEAPVKLNQSKPLTAEAVEFTNGTITLTRNGKTVKLDDHGEIVTYNAIVQ